MYGTVGTFFPNDVSDGSEGNCAVFCAFFTNIQALVYLRYYMHKEVLYNPPHLSE